MISDLAEQVPLKCRTVSATKQQAMLTTTADSAISTVWRGACRSGRDQRHPRARPGELATRPEPPGVRVSERLSDAEGRLAGSRGSHEPTQRPARVPAAVLFAGPFPVDAIAELPVQTT